MGTRLLQTSHWPAYVLPNLSHFSGWYPHHCLLYSDPPTSGIWISQSLWQAGPCGGLPSLSLILHWKDIYSILSLIILNPVALQGLPETFQMVFHVAMIFPYLSNVIIALSEGLPNNMMKKYFDNLIIHGFLKLLLKKWRGMWKWRCFMVTRNKLFRGLNDTYYKYAGDLQLQCCPEVFSNFLSIFFLNLLSISVF